MREKEIKNKRRRGNVTEKIRIKRIKRGKELKR